jgi:ferrochelatase
VIPVERHLDAIDRDDPRAPPRVGVLLLHLGGPDDAATVEAIAAYYAALFERPEILPKAGFSLRGGVKPQQAAAEVAATLLPQYGAIGARSPVADLAASQALALENALNGRPVMAPGIGSPYLVRSASRFGRDRIDSHVAAMVASGVEHVVAIPLYPFRSEGLAGIAVEDLRRVLAGTRLAERCTIVDSYGDDPDFVARIAARVRRAIDLVPPLVRDETFLLFAVHSPPHARAKEDGYLDEVERGAQAVMRAVQYDEDRSAVAFQGFRAPCRMLEPSVRDFVLARAKTGCRAMVTVAISYVTDSFETLYDLDIDAYKAGAENGIKQMRRVPSLNADPSFIAYLASRVAKALPPALAAIGPEHP